MNNPKKRKINEYFSRTSYYSKKLKTEEISNDKCTSPLEIKLIPKSLNNSYFSEKCSKKIANERQTPSVASLFRKIKILSENSSNSKKPFTQARPDIIESRNTFKNRNEIGISQKTKRTYVDINPPINEAFEEINIQISQNDSNKCNLLPSTSKWPNLHQSSSFETIQSGLNATNFGKDKVIIFKNERYRESSNQRKHEYIFQPNSKYSNEQLTESFGSKGTNCLHLAQDESKLQKHEDVPEELFSETSDLKITNTKPNISIPDRIENSLLEQSQVIEETQDFHTMHNTLFRKIQEHSFLFPIENQTNMKPSISNADISKNCVPEESQLMEETQNFHSLHNTLLQNMGNHSSRPILTIEKPMNNSCLNQEHSGKKNFTGFEKHSKRSLNQSISQTMFTRGSSFENFVENFTYSDSENENAFKINDSNSFLKCVDYNKVQNNSCIENPIPYLKFHLLESNDQKEMAINSKMDSKINKSSLRSEIKSKIICQEKTYTTFKEKYMYELNKNDKMNKKSVFCLGKKHSDSYKYVNTEQNSLHSDRDNIEKLPENVKTMAKKSIFPSYGRKKTKFLSCLEGNQDNHYSEKNTKLSYNLSNQNLEQNGSKSQFYECHQKQNVRRNSEANKISYGTQEKKEKCDEIPLQQPQKISCIKSNNNLIQNFDNIGISEHESCESSNQEEGCTKEVFSRITNSVLNNSKTLNKKCESFFEKELEMFISQRSDISSPVLMNENIENLTTDNDDHISNVSKNKDQASNMSKRIIQNEILLNTQHRKLPNIHNFSKYSDEDSQNEIRESFLELHIPQLCSNVTNINSQQNCFQKNFHGDMKQDTILESESENFPQIHYDETNTEYKLQKIISTAHTTVPQYTASNDIVISENVASANTSVNQSFSQNEYDLLKKTFSPLLADIECRSYLKSLIEEEISGKISNSDQIHVSKRNDIVSTKNKYFNTSKNLESKKSIENSICYKDSQEKEFQQFWENLSSQKENLNFEDITHSTNVSKVSNTDESLSKQRSQNSNTEKEEIPKGSKSEIINYILSQDFSESDSLLKGILINMNSLSQKPMKQRNSLHNFNQNSNKLLELALKMYQQFSTNVILSNTEKNSSSRVRRNKVEVQEDKDVRIYRLKENTTDEFMILKMKPDSNDYFESENHNFTKTSNHEADEKILQGLGKIYLDKTFLYKQEDDSLYFTRCDKISIISKIEEIFENVLEDFAANKSPELRVRRHTFGDCVIDREGLMLKSDDKPRMVKIHYKNVLSQPKFCLMMYVLAKSLELLRSNTKITKREMYYQIKTFVSTQDKVNSAIKAVSCMLSVGPWQLNIIAHKGMVFGDLKITLSTNEIINCNVPGTLIPHDVDDFIELKSSAHFILVVEKESIYYKLLEEDLPNRLVKPFIMITGKGFPDLNSQLFLRKLWMVMSLPVFILTDADPHGVNIMITYRFGSLANAHISNQLSVPKAKWLGVFPSEITKFDAEKQALTENEKLVIKNILKTPYMTDNPKIEAELKIMLELGHKAGIEGIIKNDTFLSEFYFPMKFYNQDLI